MTTVLVAMLAATSPALAQTTATATASTATTAAAPDASGSLRPLSAQVRFTDLHGAQVYDTQDKKLGQVEDVVFDRSGRVAAVVIDVGSFLGIGGKNVAVSLHELRITAADGGKLRLQSDMTKQQLKSAQAFDLNPKDTSAGSSTAPAGPPRIDSGR